MNKNKLPKAILSDLDGTLFNADELNKLYVPKDSTDRKAWDEYLKHYALCTPNKPAVEVIKAFHKMGYVIIFMTAREDRFDSRMDTQIEIHKAIGDIDFKLYMRPNENYDKSQKVKKKLYNSYVKDVCDVLFVLDDNKENCKMFRKQGITAFRYEDAK